MAFKNIIGQKKAVNILLGTMARNRIPSAYLFAGESGIGKKLTAINLAKTLNCQNSREALSVMRDGIKIKTHYALRITHHELTVVMSALLARK